MEGISKNKSGLTFLWKIKNFHACPLRGDKCLVSPKFTSELLDNTEWTLRLYPNFQKKMYLLLRCQKELIPICVQIEVFIKKNDGSIVKEKFSNANNLVEESIGLRCETASIFQDAALFIPCDTLTVGCYIEKISDQTFKAEHLVAHTEISTENFSTSFPLIFPFSTAQVQQLISIPVTSVNEKYPNFKIVLRSDTHLHSVKSLKIQIEMSKSSFRVFTVCKLSLQGAGGKSIFLVDDERWFHANTDHDKWELQNSVTEQEALVQNINTIFTLQCKISLTDGTHTTKIESLVCLQSGDELVLQSCPECPKKHTLKEKLRSFYSDGRLCDFTIHVDSKEFSVHKTVLGTVSPVFCAMLERDMTEKENSSLTIVDIDADTEQRLIEFAYKESVDDLEWDTAVKLFSAADKYQIIELKQICAELMNSKLSIENVTHALAVADLYQDSYLRKAAEDFVYSNFNEVLKSEKWNEFMENYMKLANNIMREICMKSSSPYCVRYAGFSEWEMLFK